MGYANVDYILNNLPDDLPYKASIKRILIQAEGVNADVVEVIRCKECKHALTNARIREGFYTCELTKTVPADHWCSWAIRREDE